MNSVEPRPIQEFSWDLPPRQQGEHAWRGDEMGDSARWTWNLSGSEIDELLKAAEAFVNCRQADLATISQESFPLPCLAPRLTALRRRLTHGRGFELIRGFPSTEVGETLSAAVFVGLGCYLGSPRSQNAAGDRLGHVRNIGLDPNDPEVRIYQTNARQTFHTDSADVVGLMCLETAESGGESLVCSAPTIYNLMLDRAPHLFAELFKPVATDRRGEVPPGAEPFFTIPVLNWYDGALTVKYQRQYIDSAQRFSQAPRLSPAYTQALDLFDEIANDPNVHVRMMLKRGDMQFVHNHSMLHDRTGFVDRPGSPRHLLRLWLAVPGDRELPPVFAQRFGSTVVGDRGGIVVAD